MGHAGVATIVVAVPIVIATIIEALPGPAYFVGRGIGSAIAVATIITVKD